MDDVAEGLRSPQHTVFEDWVAALPIAFPHLLPQSQDTARGVRRRCPNLAHPQILFVAADPLTRLCRVFAMISTPARPALHPLGGRNFCLNSCPEPSDRDPRAEGTWDQASLRSEARSSIRAIRGVRA